MAATDQKILDKLVTARIALLLKHPFFGNLATRLKIVNADDWCPTAATDGNFPGGPGVLSNILGTGYYFAGGGGSGTYLAVVGGNGGIGGGGGGASSG